MEQGIEHLVNENLSKVELTQKGHCGGGESCVNYVVNIEHVP